MKLKVVDKPNINTSRYWDQIWKTEGLSTWRVHKTLFDYIVNIVPYDSKVLELGCGIGKLLERVRDERNSTVVGIDHSPEAIKLLKSQGMYGVVKDLEHKDTVIEYPDNYFDTILAVSLIEHQSHPEYTMDHIKRLLSPKGIAIVVVPDNVMLPDYPDYFIEHMIGFNIDILTSFLQDYFNDIDIEKLGEDLIAIVYGDEYNDYNN